MNDVLRVDMKSPMASKASREYFVSIRLFAFLLFFALTEVHALCQPLLPSPEPHYYTVLGSFAIHENAKRFVAHLADSQIASQYIFASEKGIYYVYTDVVEDKKKATEIVLNFRKNREFYDAWVMRIPAADEEWNDPHVSGFTDTSEHRRIETSDLVVSEKRAYARIPLPTPRLFVSVFDAGAGRALQGKVRIIDTGEARQLREVDANQSLSFPEFKSVDRISLICDIFGYKKMQHDLNIADPLSDSTDNVKVLGNMVVVHFDLMRYRRGDIVTLYNVYFYNDASIMMNESRFQLMELLTFLQNNPDMHIKLHEHSNGNGFGRILISTSFENFFSLTRDVKQIFGSAKELSYQRALMVKDFLVYKGIDEQRITVTAWGGRRPIYTKHSPNAKKNLRVDVEITQD